MNEPKLIIFDLEIIPDLRQALKYWPMLSSWYGQTLKAQVTSICCFGYKIFGEKKSRVINAWDFSDWDKDVNDDKKLCAAANEILQSADAFIYQNGDKFDLKYVKSRFIKHGLPPLSKVPTIDTKKEYKKHAYVLSNSLKNLAEYFSDDRKFDHGLGWELWERVHGRDEAAMKIMSKYCRKDVDATESIFKPIRPYCSQIPNHNLWNLGTKDQCPMCGSTRLISNGYRNTKTSSYKRLRCQDCGGSSSVDLKGQTPRSF